MKKILLPALILLLCMISGCACEHQWTEADCLNPQVCEKCEETGTPAFGHDWAGATCTAPETCQRCGELQGQPLGHSYGDWQFGETDMTHTCDTCNFEETTELDREVFLETLLEGYWEFSGIFTEDSFYSAYQESTPGEMLRFSEGKTVSGSYNAAEISGTWELDNYVREEETDLYYFNIVNADGKTNPLVYTHKADGGYINGFFSNNVQILLEQNRSVADAIIGTWGAKSNTGYLSLTFREDRTVSGNLGTEFEGTWQLMPMTDTYGIPYCGIYIMYTQDGEEAIQKASIFQELYPSEELSIEDFQPKIIRMNIGAERLEFEPMDLAEIAAQDAAFQDAAAKILGTWTSKYLSEEDYVSDLNLAQLNTGYSITFLEDGTFTASIGQEYSGTWRVHSASGTPDNPSYHYVITIPQTWRNFNCRLKSRPGGLELSIGNIIQEKNTFFARYSPEQMDNFVSGVPLLVGTWTGSYIDYSITFLEDGTFTGMLDQEISGTWGYRGYHPDDDFHSYWVESDHPSLSTMFTIKESKYIYIDGYELTKEAE